MSDKTVYYGHTNPNDPPTDKRRWQHMKEHASEVARRAEDKAAPFGEADRANLAGLLHDLGKYGQRFQDRLEGKESGLDHWSVGAFFVKQHYRDAALALVIQGHHIGLQEGSKEKFDEFTLEALKAKHPLELRLTEPEPHETNFKLLLSRLMADGLTPAGAKKPELTPGQSAADMLDTRMLFSALVDADYLDTEEAMRLDGVDPRPDGEQLDAVRALAVLESHLAELGENTKVPADTRALRADLMRACREAGLAEERLWTLTAPTGSGKTLAMLLFALTRAAKMQEAGQTMRRIVVVLPFLTILDQTVDQYRELFGRAGFAKHIDDFVVEHHSLAGIRTNESQSDLDDSQPSGAKFFVQNWDAPIIITTSVQLLESLHANKPGACRKLHRLARSIILMDEVQTLPAALAVPTLKTLSRLTHEKYGAVVVMATATQPAFDTLSGKVREEGQNDGWQPREMAPRELQLFERSKRVHPVWKLDDPVSFDEVADWIRDDPAGQVLCIVNMRKHAKALAEKLNGNPGLRHVSTYLCPAHRRKIMGEVRAALDDKKPMRLVATQCVEAGVDLDFPTVIRALGPLDSIAQAAGRCNRHKKLPSGELRVFLPDEEQYPTPAYRRAAQVALTMYREGGLNLDDPATFKRFYERLWRYEATDMQELRDAITRQDYPKVAELYRLIPNDSVNVVVPYGDGVELIREATQCGITRDWMRRAQLYTVSIFCNRDGTLPTHVEPVNFRPRGGELPKQAPDWYVCPDSRAYDEELYGFLLDGGEANPFIQ